jgi:hypothetical protein
MAAAAPAREATAGETGALPAPAPTLEQLVLETRQCLLRPAQFFCAWQVSAQRWRALEKPLR